MLDIACYRMRIGLNFLRSVRLPFRKCLDLECLIFYLLYVNYRYNGVMLYFLCRIVCNFYPYNILKLTCDLQTFTADYHSQHTLSPRFPSLLTTCARSLSTVFFICGLLIIICGDVELNPGPSSTSNSSSFE